MCALVGVRLAIGETDEGNQIPGGTGKPGLVNAIGNKSRDQCGDNNP